MNQYSKLFLILMLLGLFFASEVNAQKRGKRTGSFHKGRYKSIKISKRKAQVVCPIFEESKYPYQGIGFKLGDPFAATYKFYATKSFSIVADFGTAASGLYSQYHRDNFDEYTATDTLGQDQGISYLSHKVKSEWVFEGKLLYQHDASSFLDGLQWYIGAGWQWRQLSIDYEYLLEIDFSQNEIDKFGVSNATMGPTGVIGIEYAYFELPISAFLEIEGYYDIDKDPGWLRIQGGVGLRYVF